ncbi:hypothetical protein [uncultured Tenacibaculum sp.]|uniref:hypothetical protein n=1 Tax=uncultured Tenacibaculum sp. TaxID=174713 RepID=UPI00260A1364|nr:hypothetical protein [uncultured Tenacibaculum sp.]
MLKSISTLGTVLNKTAQKSINGGGPGSPFWCNNRNNWGPNPVACTQNEVPTYSQSLGYCICRPTKFAM